MFYAHHAAVLSLKHHAQAGNAQAQRGGGMLGMAAAAACGPGLLRAPADPQGLETAARCGHEHGH